VNVTKVKVIRIPAPQWSELNEWCTSPMDIFKDSGMGDTSQYGLFNGGHSNDTTLYVIVRVETSDGTVY
jgi:hypothetical protein